MSSPSVCLVMIVRNEAHVLRRCLSRLAPLCDRVVIVDTGSGEAQLRIMRNIVHGAFPDHSYVFERTWRNFANNRTEAIELACEYSSADFLLMFDADDVLYAPPGAGFGAAFDGRADLYTIPMWDSAVRFSRRALMRRGMAWYYTCPVHEILLCRTGHTGPVDLPECVIMPQRDSARAHDPAKFSKDAAILQRHLAEHPDDARAQFYFGQCLECAGQPREAYEAYRKRGVMHGGYYEERGMALLRAACIAASVCKPDSPDDVFTAVLDEFFEAHAAFEGRRAEPLYHAIHFASRTGRQCVADQMVEVWKKIPPTACTLFVDPKAYFSQG